MSEAIESRVEEIFYQSMRIDDEAERATFVARACGGDAALLAAVEKALEEEAAAERFFDLNRPILPQSAEAVQLLLRNADLKAANGVDFDPDRLVGSHVGHYKLLQKIGEGGCGAVYLAEQEKPVHRTVALKVIKLGMDTRNVITRFEAERQALALMDHPNIARVFDAGATETGRPYFVMELVRGTKITTFCDEQRLEVPERLNLFIQVCSAVQHAHQKGIVHRDIKPSNILVSMADGKPVPKVIDFGIAKATTGEKLTDNTIFTAQDQFVGTPAYMSPEQTQCSSIDIDTRSDIYSLGVLLYELLTGKTPFDQADLLRSGLDEMRRTLLECEPHRPSTRLDALKAEELTQTTLHRHVEPPRLKSLLKGDLDWIVMKALEKDRDRRYQTVNGLAMDVERFLKNEPIVARPPSRLYRLRKTVRRNRAAFVAGALVALALIGGLSMSTWFWLSERKARVRAVAAERRATEAGQQQERLRKEQERLRMEAEDRERITQAAFLLSQERIAEADALAGKVLVLKPSLEAENVLRTLGQWHVMRKEWRAAAERFDLLLQVDQRDNSWEITADLLKAAPILIELGDLQAYERFRRAAIVRYTDTADPVFAERTIKSSLLLPMDDSGMKTLEPLFKVSVDSMQGAPDPHDGMSAWRCISIALMEYRKNNLNAATAWSQKCLTSWDFNAARAATAHIIVAMASYRSGQAGAARAELAQSRQPIEAAVSGDIQEGNWYAGFWFDWLFAKILLHEADGLVAERTAAN